jgi:hypothetical protein
VRLGSLLSVLLVFGLLFLRFHWLVFGSTKTTGWAVRQITYSRPEGRRAKFQELDPHSSFISELPMAKLTPQQQAGIQALFPSLVAWAEEMETKALSEGTPLSDLLKARTASLGIRKIDAVRVLSVNSIPEPSPPRITEIAKDFGLSFADSAGMTFRYAIFVRRSYAQDVHLLAHELVHVRQYEHAGSISRYLEEYLRQLVTHGYQNMPLEIQAVRESVRIFGYPRR